jgi:hypothetical protein
VNQTPSSEQLGDDRPGLDLDAIMARALRIARQYAMPDETDQDDLDRLTDFDVPQLVAEVRGGRIALENARAQIANHEPVLAALAKARERIAELEAASEPQHFGICFTNVRGHRLVNAHCLYCGMSAEEATS